MYGRLLWRSFNRNWSKKLLLIVTIAAGSSLATAVLNLSLDVGDKVSRELKRYGANITVQPLKAADQEALLKEADIGKIKTIFWSNNILAFAPYLTTKVAVDGQSGIPLVGTWFAQPLALPTGEAFTTGVRSLKDWWRVDGDWPRDPTDVLVGQRLAGRLNLKPGQSLPLTSGGGVSKTVTVRGVLDSGGPEDEWLLAPLLLVQEWTGHVGQVERVDVSALTTPENQLALVAARDPSAVSGEAFETWYCTAYAGSIAYQIQEVIPGAKARPLQGVSKAEGAILVRVQALMSLLAVVGLAVAGLGISNLMQAKVRERQQELGLMRSLGGSRSAVAGLFLGESVVEGSLGGLAGYGLGTLLAWGIGRTTFGIAVAPRLAVLPLVLVLVLLVTLVGSVSSLMFLLRLQPSRVLRGS